jgi:glycine amidinotransferase/scyllo-inosamine-4-phosphate amidinotransferase 1
MNLLMINSHLAIVDAAQTALITTPQAHAVEVIPLTLRHGRALGGGFHCSGFLQGPVFRRCASVRPPR